MMCSLVVMAASHRGVGRGCGVGRGRGVALGVLEGAGVAVGVGLTVAVGVGVGPCAVVLRMAPKAPTAVPLFVSVKETLYRSWFVPLFCGTQFSPPSVVLRITLSPVTPPTTVPVLTSVK